MGRGKGPEHVRGHRHSYTRAINLTPNLKKCIHVKKSAFTVYVQVSFPANVNFKIGILEPAFLEAKLF